MTIPSFFLLLFNKEHLEAESSAFRLLVTAKLEMLATLDSNLVLVFAGVAFETQHNLLGSLGLLVEDGLSLTTVSRLLTVVTTLSLCKQ